MDDLLRRPFLTCLTLTALAAGGCATARPDAAGESLEGNARQLTRGFAEASDAVFSPDMRWIAFRARPADEEGAQLYLAPLRSERGEITGIGQPIRVTPPGTRNASPTFSADGRTLLFSSTAASQTDPLEVGSAEPGRFDPKADLFRVDGWQRNLAAADPRVGVNFARHPLAPHPGYDGQPAFTPDGRHVIFASDRAAPESALDTRSLVDLWAMRSDGTGLVRLTDWQGYDGAPAVTPDGRNVVFQSEHEHTGRFHIYIAPLSHDDAGNITGIGRPRRLTDQGSNTAPAIAPNAARLVYVRVPLDEANAAQLRQVRPDGRRDRAVTRQGGQDAASVSPDGRYLLFSAPAEDGTRQIHLMPYRPG